MARVDDSVAEVDENVAKGGRWRGRHHPPPSGAMATDPHRTRPVALMA